MEERHKSNTVDIFENEKVNPSTQKTGKIKRRKCDICGRDESQIFIK